MKVIAFAARADEQSAFDMFSKQFGMELKLVSENLSEKTVEQAKGFDGVSIVGNCLASRSVLEALHHYGVQAVASRSTGYDNIDLEAAKEFGLRVSNSMYSPHSVGEFTVMCILNLLRQMPYSRKKAATNDFSLKGLQGKELHNQVVGVIGTGKIGKIVVQGLTGFGCETIVYDPFPSKEVEQMAQYVSLDELFLRADVITMHIPLTGDNTYMINKKTIARMKDHVYIVNTSRGELIHTGDLIDALQSGKVGGVALDVIEGEQGIFHHDCSAKPFSHDNLVLLKNMNNVQITGHHAFYTNQAVSDMVECSLTNLHSFHTTGDGPNAL